MAATKGKELRVRQVRSAIGANPKQVANLKSLGLGRVGAEATRADGAQLRGQLDVVSHLVETEEVS